VSYPRPPFHTVARILRHEYYTNIFPGKYQRSKCSNCPTITAHYDTVPHTLHRPSSPLPLPLLPGQGYYAIRRNPHVAPLTSTRHHKHPTMTRHFKNLRLHYTLHTQIKSSTKSLLPITYTKTNTLLEPEEFSKEYTSSRAPSQHTTPLPGQPGTLHIHCPP